VSKRLVIEPEAEADLLAAYEWYEEQRAGLGDDLLLCIEAALEAIRDRPTSFPIAHETTRRALTRRFPYLVLFVEGTVIISVIGIFHTSRDPKSWKLRLGR
jgi:plasmid stabilization system protein ParE